jgi:hypothetical protein
MLVVFFKLHNCQLCNGHVIAGLFGFAAFLAEKGRYPADNPQITRRYPVYNPHSKRGGLSAGYGRIIVGIRLLLETIQNPS